MAVCYIYRRKIVRVPQMPDAPVWWVKSPYYSSVGIPEIDLENKNFCYGQSMFTPESAFEAGLKWSVDRKTWYDFCGYEVF